MKAVRPRLFLPALLLACTLPAAGAQVTLTADDLLYSIGTNNFTQRFTNNEDGSNTATLDDLIARGGANQTYDFSAVVFEALLEGDIVVESGATGPGAGESPLDQATFTARFPFEMEEDGETFEGEAHLYQRVTDDEFVHLGTHLDGELGGMTFASTIRNTPDGARQSVFPLTFGTTWSTSYTQEGFVTSTVDADYEVDGWGTLTGPGFPAVPVLRVRRTAEITTFATAITTVTYEFRSATNVFAEITAGDPFGPPTASLTITGAVAPTAVEEPAPSGVVLGPARPNPVTSQAAIAYRLPSPQTVRLVVYDLLGREVAVLVDGTRRAGWHEVVLDPQALPGGVYAYRLEAGPHRQASRLTVVR